MATSTSPGTGVPRPRTPEPESGISGLIRAMEDFQDPSQE